MTKTAFAFWAGVVCLSASAWTWADNTQDANDPTKERYCDPAQNADIFAKLKQLEDKLNALDAAQVGKRSGLVSQMAQLTRQLKCTYRLIQNQAN